MREAENVMEKIRMEPVRVACGVRTGSCFDSRLFPGR